jgi:hypothetical protein
MSALIKPAAPAEPFFQPINWTKSNIPEGALDINRLESHSQTERQWWKGPLQPDTGKFVRREMLILFLFMALWLGAIVSSFVQLSKQFDPDPSRRAPLEATSTVNR